MHEHKISEDGDLACSPLHSHPNSSTHILVVDDNEFIRQLNTNILVHSGYKVDNAVDGEMAWQALNASRYDLLITDNSMPNVSGVELLKRLHRSHMAIPVIMSTAALPAEDFACHPEIQPAATLLKPFTLSQLLETVRTVLRVNARRPEETGVSQPLADRSPV